MLHELAEAVHVEDVDFGPFLALTGWANFVSSVLSVFLVDRGHAIIAIGLGVQVGRQPLAPPAVEISP
jgi:hypothetical protein